MNTAWLGRPIGRALIAVLGFVVFHAFAQQPGDEDPPGRVGRLADTRGGVSWYDAERGVWDDAERNRPLTSGDRLSTTPQGRAELRVGSTVLRIAGGSEVELVRIDDERLVFQLHQGSLALRVKTREKAEEIEVVTREVRLAPQRAGHYRIDRIDDSTFAGTWRGDLRVEDPFGFVIATGQRAELWREGGRRGGPAGQGSGGDLRHSWTRPLDDDFAGRVLAEDRLDDQRSVASQYVSPEMTGADDLDRHGRWDRHPEYGAVWFPIEVRAGWAPYRYGRWAWVRPWGWTWVDEAPWGFAPFHYGRWVFWNNRWGWCPGAYVPRPVFAPALVAWIGGPRLSVSVQIGGPTVGWVPLAPRDTFVPYYRHTPRYVERVNPGRPLHPGDGRPGQPWRGEPRPIPAQPIMYGNQGVPGAVTVVPRDALLQRQPIGRVAVAPEGVRDIANTPFADAPPPVPNGGMGPPRPVYREPERAPSRPFQPPQAVQPQPQPQPQRQPQPPVQAEPGPTAPGMPRSAPERAFERQQPQPQVQPMPAPMPQAQPQPVDRTTVERNGDERRGVWPRRGLDSEPDPRRERVAPRPQPQPQPQAQPMPQAQQPQPQPQPAQATGPQRPIFAPQPAPAPAPAAQPQPQRPPEARRPPAEDERRQRLPDSRQNPRERENTR
jgi:hypothetical protein